jgi:hypothetical protein
MTRISPDRVSFEKDIVPIFRQFRRSMIWRFDLTRYEDVRGNASKISAFISSHQMPPPPFPHLTEKEITLFNTWMAQDFPA